jgi:23S rRNA (guanosine2251-2'-O)-methyltransferase
MERLVGRNPVIEALRAGRPINKIMLARTASPVSLKEIVALARKQKVLLQYVERKQLDLLTGGEVHQGVVALAAAKEYSDWEEVLAKTVGKGETPLFLMLDGIEDPHNLGAILRTADAAGVHCVIIPKHRAVPLTSGVAKASAGAIEYVPVSRVTNIAQTIKKLKEKGFWIAGTDQDAKEDYFNTDLKGPLVVVLGSEGKGLGKLVSDKCDFLLKIPMQGRINSLNVSIAASVILYEIVRQRRGVKGLRSET